MVSLAIVIFCIGMIILPLSRLYILWQKREPGSRFDDAVYTRRFRTKIRLASIGCAVIAILILTLLQQS